MRVAAVDIGTNTTRMLVAEVARGRVVSELDRRTEITRLGEGVDATGELAEAAIERVLDVCAAYSDAIEASGVARAVAIMTSAVRDAANGGRLADELRDRFGFEPEMLSGEREARLTYRGATSWRGDGEPLLVLDIGGGSTELVVGASAEVEFHVSTQVGAVRFTERYLAGDPPAANELAACSEVARTGIGEAVPERVRRRPASGIAVAGTPSSLAAIELGLEPYDRDRVNAHRLARESCERIVERLAELPLAERRRVQGLHPGRAPTIVAGGLILIEAMALFGLDAMEVSERDILEGAALEAAEKFPERP
jgi:exopolyphosphatase/guanosine-5'-triphosphate,3'-diphosphate pyrophosphatase